jgi:hypothetical protein
MVFDESPHAPLLRATRIGQRSSAQATHRAGYTEGSIAAKTFLNEPQGKLEKWQRFITIVMPILIY